MRLMSFADSTGRARLGVLDNGTVRDVTDALWPGDGAAGDGGWAGPVASPMRRLLTSGLDITAVARAVTAAPEADTRTLLPVMPDPSKIVAAPVNYRDHQAEMTQTVAIESMGVFLKAPSSLIAAGGEVRLPYHDRRFDQEGELGVIIGRTASDIPVGVALDYVAGYTCLLDMTMRGGEDRSVRKSFDSFTPLGPHLVTSDEVGDPSDLELRTWVGGDLRQRADLSDLIWDVPRLVHYISSVMTLHPGDVIATGTPAGVGEVTDGQRITVEISRVGRLEVSVSSSGASACPTLGHTSGPRPPSTVTPPRERHHA